MQLKEAEIEYEDDNPALLLFIYKTFPPKNDTHRLPEEDKMKSPNKKEIQKILQKAVLHYHPDKQNAEEHGMKWKVLCNDITKLLTSRYESYCDNLHEC